MWKRKKGAMIAHCFDSSQQVSTMTLVALCGVQHRNFDLISVTAWPRKCNACTRALYIANPEEK